MLRTCPVLRLVTAVAVFPLAVQIVRGTGLDAFAHFSIQIQGDRAVIYSFAGFRLCPVLEQLAAGTA
jgi:hypothetical protein